MIDVLKVILREWGFLLRLWARSQLLVGNSMISRSSFYPFVVVFFLCALIG